MPRLIDADAFEKVIDEKFQTHYGNSVYQFIHDFFRCIIRQINKAPTIDPESLRAQGEWVDLYGGKYANPRYACSNCGEKALYKFERDNLDRTIAVQALSESCPNCGAKMKGETK